VATFFLYKVLATVMALLDHCKNRHLVSASLVALGCLCGLAPVDLAAQNPVNQQIRSASPQEIVERLRQSGLSNVQVREQLLRAGYDPDMADPYFDMMEGVGEAPTGGTDEFVTVLDDLGILLRDVEIPFEAGPGVGLSDADSLVFLTGLLDALEGESLPMFGKSFFERSTSFQFRPLENGAVGADYRLGPGDEVILLITGDVEISYSFDVNRSGIILIPDVGQVSVSGITITDLENRLYDRLGAVYSGISRGGDATTHFDVSLGALRTIAVYVSGEVERPNRYPLSSVGTLLEALYAAGGPTEIGSLRRVRIERGQMSLGEFDLYPYFVDGSSSGDIRLENGDLVFVPPVESQVTLAGAVRREAIFEMRVGETASDLLRFAGGLKPEANRIGTVDRTLPPEERTGGFERVILDLPVGEEGGGGANSFEMFSGDDVTIHQVGAWLCDEEETELVVPTGILCDDRGPPSAVVRNWVEVVGAVWSPGIYQVTPGQTLSDLLETSGGVRPDGIQSIVHISRLDQNTGQRSLVRTELSSAGEISLEEFDRVTLFGRENLLVPDEVSIFGLVRTPGAYMLDHDMNAEDLILMAGGFIRGAIPWEVEIVHPIFDNPSILSQSRSAFLSGNLPYPDSSVAWPEASILPRINVVDIPLGPGFEVYVRRLPGYQDVRHITISGEVIRPGAYVLQRPDEKLTSIIRRAGGLTQNAYPEGGRVTRIGVPVGTDFVSALNGNLQEDLVLQDEDEINIPIYDPTILVEGAVAFESRMRYRAGMDLAEVIENAGGYVYDADPGRVSIEYLNGQRSTVRKILWVFKDSPEITPGSRVSVPLKSETPDGGFNWNSALSATLASLTAFSTVYIALIR
jgi:polysaccharide export outer membrane protein